MKAFHSIAAACATSALSLTGQTAHATIESLTLDLVFNTHVAEPANYQGSLFYLNDNLRGSNLIAGQIGYGVWEIDQAGNVVNFIRTNETLSVDNAGSIGNPPIGAKSALSVGSFVMLGANGHAGIARFDRVGPEAWNPASLTPLTNPSGNVESIAANTNGTMLFTNESTNDNAADPSGGGQDTIHGYNLSNFANSFSLDEVWRADVNSTITHPDPAVEAILTPRFRGVSHSPNGFVYAVDNGNGGQGSIWAFDASDGTAFNLAPFADPRGLGENFLTEVLNGGIPGSVVPTEYNAGFGVVRRDAPEDMTDELLVVTSGGFLRSYDLLDDTVVGDFRDFDMQAIFHQAGITPTAETRVALFGAAYDETNDFLWLSFQAEHEGSARRVAGFSITDAPIPSIPEPTTATLLLTTAALLGKRRRK